jgi:uncharacterized protein (TIGR03000 family)
MRRVSTILWLLVAVSAWSAANEARAEFETRYHRGWKAYVRDGQMFGYPGARYWGGTHSWYPPGVTPWQIPYAGCCGMDGYGYGGYGGSGTGYGGMRPNSANLYESVPDKQGIPSGSLLLNVRVPQEAVVFINGLPTSTTGSDRPFMTSNLEPGLSYTYEVRAEIPVDGEMVSQTQTVTIAPGKTHTVTFKKKDAVAELARRKGPALNVAEGPRSTLTLHVPEEARVFVNDTPMRTGGSVRTFGATLPEGTNKTPTYTVRVELDRDGKTLVREEIVSMVAGGDRAVTIDFGAATATPSRNTQR